MKPSNNNYLIQVFEHQTLRIGEVINGVPFTKELAKALAIYHQQHGGKYYQLQYKGVKFKQYVGIIQIGKWSIEILPKIDQSTTTHPNHWQKVLIEMLQYCQLLKIESAGLGSVQLTNTTILVIYFELFLLQVQRLLKTGLPRQYVSQTTNSKHLKGRLDLPKHLRNNQFHPERFYIRHQTLTEEHLFNQILQEALKVLAQVFLPAPLKSLLTKIMATFPKLPPYQWEKQDFDRLFQNKSYQPYHQTIELAQLILLNFSSDIRYGKHQLIALLFDMNLLFEEYIYAQLKKIASPTLLIKRQTSIPFWQRRSIRPDILIEIEGEKIVLDTKWKVLDNDRPSIEDLKQMYIYCRYFKAQKGMLLFPTANPTNKTTTQPFLDEAKNIHCQILLLNVLNKAGQLKENIGEEIKKVMSYKL